MVPKYPVPTIVQAFTSRLHLILGPICIESKFLAICKASENEGVGLVLVASMWGRMRWNAVVQLSIGYPRPDFRETRFVIADVSWE